jgi:hypothetical protein
VTIFLYLKGFKYPYLVLRGHGELPPKAIKRSSRKTNKILRWKAHKCGEVLFDSTSLCERREMTRRNTKSNNNNASYDAPRGIRACWRSWRHCMCTTGWYPVAVAPMITIGFLLSLYSSAGCEFIDLHVGFTPSNAAWNQSQANLGLFYLRDNSAASETNSKMDFLHDGCVWYSDTFQGSVIEQDRTWRVARYMAMIAVATSLLSALTIWLVVFVPVPIQCVWPGVMLPATMLSFIAEGSKFLMFDIALCKNAVWYPSGVNSLPEEAQSCQLGISAYVGIAAVVIHFVSLLSICLKAPEKRHLDPNFGIRQDVPEEFLEATTDRDYKYETYEYEGEDIEVDPSILDDDLYTDGPTPSSNSLLMAKGPYDEFSTTSQDDDSSDPAVDEPTTLEPPPLEVSVASEPSPRISESRIAAMSKMHPTTSFETYSMIDELVTDLDTSLADDRY